MDRKRAEKERQKINLNHSIQGRCLRKSVLVWGEPEKSIGSVMEGLNKTQIKPEQGPILCMCAIIADEATMFAAV